ncbi:MAG: TRZ/ATZ family hydrolase [Pseudomonadota bacterium]
MKTCETLIECRWIASCAAPGEVLENHAVAIDQGQIIAVLPQTRAHDEFSPRTTVKRPQHLLTPGFVNTHTHAAMSLMRGICDDLPLDDWLRRRIWPTEQRIVGAEMVRDGTTLAVAEMLASGTTCFADMYFYADSSALAAEKAGIRMVAGLIVSDQPSRYAGNYEAYLQKGLQIHDQLRGSALISTQFALDSPTAGSDSELIRLQALADELDLRVHMHAQETRAQTLGCIEQFGQRPLQRLKKLGLLTDMLSIAHGVDLSSDDIQMLADVGAHVAHCPESNAKLASGIAPVVELRRAGVNVALGTDGAASNNDLDMLSEMKSSIFCARLREGRTDALDAYSALETATINGARALGLATRIGSVETGKSADLTIIDLDHPATWPVYSPVSQMMYAASRDQITDTWVAGKAVYENASHKTIDLSEVRARSLEWQQRISQPVR